MENRWVETPVFSLPIAEIYESGWACIVGKYKAHCPEISA
jgi:hypothetical protein